MKNRFNLRFVFAIAVWLLLPISVQAQHKSAKEQLDEITSSYWLREQKTGRAFALSGTLFPDQLYKGTKEDYAKDFVYFTKVLGQLKKINRQKLPATSLTDYDLMTWLSSMRLEATRFYDLAFPQITPYSSYSGAGNSLFPHLALNTAADLQKYLELLHEFSKVLAADLDKLKYQDNKGIRIQKNETELAIGLMKSYQRAAATLPMYVQKERLQKFDTLQQKSFQAQVTQVLEQEVIPAYGNLARFLEGDYLKKTPLNVGLSQYPSGKEYYQYLVKLHTTTDFTPDEIFTIGQNNVVKINHALDSLRKLTGFDGSRKEFLQFMQKDKRFLATTPDEVGARLKSHLIRMEKVIPQLISIGTKRPYDVRRLPLSLEPGMTFGYYSVTSESDSVGVYLYNGSKLDQRSLVSAASLAFHEIMPGHHLQICLQKDNAALPAYRRNLQVNSYLEGWGDYASFLGEELGLYGDPYDYCGRLLMDMFISVRLVVDVGMNYKGWSREQAMQFMRDNVIESEEQIKTETLRYSCDIQGQALGYKMGSRRFQELRLKYAKLLGDKFDVIQFHNAILAGGCLPMAILEKSLDRQFGVAR
jgi:uncharacterized protein (DUF885 family)